jgi:membrane-associated phospholipid phosphatase
LALVVTIGAYGCAKESGPSSEPTAKSWRPIVLASSDAIRVPPPPAPGSPLQRQELDELIALRTHGMANGEREATFWNLGACVRWNEIARDLVAKHRTDIVSASRVYALLSVAQYDALVATWNNKYFYGRRAPGTVSPKVAPLFAPPKDPVYPSEHAAVAASSAAVLADIYPDEATFLRDRANADELSRLQAGVNFRSDLTAGEEIGRAVATAVIARRRGDGADAVWKGTVPTGEGRWRQAPGREAVAPLWGRVEPWLMSSGEQFRAPPPPPGGSPEFRAALSEVRRMSDTRTQEQTRIAALWADGDGSYTPTGRWNKIAADLILKHELSEIAAARVFALLNMSQMDAGIASWDSKYHYWVIRPYQADPAITTPVGQPEFPSYTAAHATLSGAAAEVLGHLFPKDSGWLRERAEEAALSRLYGGIHYRFDLDAGLAQGRALARLAIQRGRSDGSPQGREREPQ